VALSKSIYASGLACKEKKSRIQIKVDGFGNKKKLPVLHLTLDLNNEFWKCFVIDLIPSQLQIK